MRFYALIQNGVPSAPVIAGRLAADVASGATTIDFGQEMIVGHYVLIRAIDQSGNTNIEHLLVGSLVSDTTYNVTRDVLGETVTNPAWWSGTKFVSNSTSDVEPPPYVMDSLDVTETLRFGTQLHGGFSSCSFSVSSITELVTLRMHQYVGAHVEIHDGLGRVVWEGYVVSTALGESPNSVTITCSGYYGRASDRFFDMIYAVFEATTNLVRNPSFENNVSDGGWSVISGGSGGSFSRVTSEYRYGTACGRILQPTSNPDYTVRVIVPVTASASYVFSFWAKKTSTLTGGNPYIQVTDQSGNLFFEESLSDISTAWQRFEMQVINAGASVTSLYIYFTVPNSSGTQGAIYIDGVQVEQKTYTTPYCDGDQSNCAWNGAAHNSTSTRTEVPITADRILIDCVEFMAPTWSALTSLVRNDMYDIGPVDYSGKRVKDAIEHVMSFGTSLDGDAYATYFAIWSGRTAEVILEPRPNYLWPNWYIHVDQVESRRSLSLSMGDIYNRVYSAYESGSSGPVPTVPSEDEYSIQRYGLREGFLQNGEVPFTATRSYFMQDAALERYRYPRPVTTIEVSGLVSSSAGFRDFPYRIRAGDTLVISDADIMSTATGSVAGQVANRLVAFVLRTEYDAESNTVRLEIGSADQSFDALMGRLGISGGLS